MSEGNSAVSRLYEDFKSQLKRLEELTTPLRKMIFVVPENDNTYHLSISFDGVEVHFHVKKANGDIGLTAWAGVEDKETDQSDDGLIKFFKWINMILKTAMEEAAAN